MHARALSLDLSFAMSRPSFVPVSVVVLVCVSFTAKVRAYDTEFGGGRGCMHECAVSVHGGGFNVRAHVRLRVGSVRQVVHQRSLNRNES